VTVVMMGQTSLDDWDEKSEKKKDHQDEVDGMRQRPECVVSLVLMLACHEVL